MIYLFHDYVKVSSSLLEREGDDDDNGDHSSQATIDSNSSNHKRHISAFEYRRLVNYIIMNIVVVSCQEQYYPYEYIQSYKAYHQQWFIDRNISPSKMPLLSSSVVAKQQQQQQPSSLSSSFDTSLVHSLRFSLAIIEHQRVSVNQQQYINYSTYLLQRYHQS